jgi:hypothetical protein
VNTHSTIHNRRLTRAVFGALIVSSSVIGVSLAGAQEPTDRYLAGQDSLLQSPWQRGLLIGGALPVGGLRNEYGPGYWGRGWLSLLEPRAPLNFRLEVGYAQLRTHLDQKTVEHLELGGGGLGIVWLLHPEMAHVLPYLAFTGDVFAARSWYSAPTAPASKAQPFSHSWTAGAALTFGAFVRGCHSDLVGATMPLVLEITVQEAGARILVPIGVGFHF